MTLEESIRFHTEEAEKMKLHRKVNEIILGTETYEIKLQEHTQTAEWLKELAERRKQPEIVYCKDCKHYKIDHPKANGYHCCYRCHNIFPMKETDFCSKAVRRTDD